MFGENSTLSEKYYISDIPRIDPVEKGVWCEALLDDEKYQQGHNMLKTPDGKFCCLGVYCNVKGLPEKQTVGNYRDPVLDQFVTGLISIFGANPVFASTVVIPDGDGIPFIQPDVRGCISWGKFQGEETIFVCKVQEDDKTYNWTLPGLNDSGLFNFSQIRDIINYFL